MTDNLKELLLAVVAMVGSISTAAIAVYAKKKNKTQSPTPVPERDFSAIMKDWGGVVSDVVLLIQTTPVDRFIVFESWSEKSEQYTNSIVQIRETGQEVVQYCDFKLDQAYKDMLKSMEAVGYHYIDVTTMQDCALKRVYIAEGVMQSYIVYIVKIKQRIYYVSFASHGESFLDQIVRTKCDLICNQIASVVKLF